MLGGNYLCAFCPDYSLAISLELALSLAAYIGKQDPDLALVAETLPERTGRSMLRIEKESAGDTTRLRLSGRIQLTDIDDIRAQMDDDAIRIILDLDEVTVVDVEVVRFLSDCEDGDIVLVHCPLFVREWIIRERAEGAQT